ncbi:ArgP/LysG family DNA-binding transcriptional regulator [Arthrobacter sp. S41]|uniref:ArgP/LysG family DNA-binding transcriptional regulator n=1 Tax=Arthrobacter sp. S41 TaxID=2509721 RepID=UPI0013EFACB0|nr:ArgP/LysG family DNA-binding transcriptional regulator [Arthrobacter sp. S41]
MNIDVEHLETLLAVVDAGSFDDASIDLGVTASAVSQRIKALENRIGAILVIRSRPVIPTEQGYRVLRYARQMALLSAEFTREISADAPLNVAIGVNADSLSTWFSPVFEQLADIENLSVEILRTDENRGLELLRSGRVSAVVTTTSQALQGCVSKKLGAMRYRAAAAPRIVERYLPRVDPEALVKTPMVVFDREDPLQYSMVARLAGQDRRPEAQVHHVPDSLRYLCAVEAGMGWGMIPELQLAEATGLKVLHEDWFADVPLYLQRWAVDSELLSKMDGILVTAARQFGLHLIA